MDAFGYSDYTDTGAMNAIRMAIKRLKKRPRKEETMGEEPSSSVFSLKTESGIIKLHIILEFHSFFFIYDNKWRERERERERERDTRAMVRN